MSHTNILSYLKDSNIQSGIDVQKSNCHLIQVEYYFID